MHLAYVTMTFMLPSYNLKAIVYFCLREWLLFDWGFWGLLSIDEFGEFLEGGM